MRLSGGWLPPCLVAPPDVIQCYDLTGLVGKTGSMCLQGGAMWHESCM